MDNSSTISKTQEWVKAKMIGEGTGHDWWHVWRVRNMAMNLAMLEKADLFIVEMAALLHDIADHKFHDGDDSIGPIVAREWLEGLKTEEKTIAHICEIIAGVSFKGAGVETPMESIEGQIVQDADRLDALGAVGIVRAFAFGGFKGHEIYNPDVMPEMHGSFDDYKKGGSHTINHFHEKLLLLKDRMNTESARRIAVQRHLFMEAFLGKFYSEWDGKM